MGRQGLEGGRLALDTKKTIQVVRDPQLPFRERSCLKHFGKFARTFRIGRKVVLAVCEIVQESCVTDHLQNILESGRVVAMLA